VKIIQFIQKESQAPKVTTLFMAILSGLANSLLLAIINVVAEKVSNHQLQLHYFFLYLTAFGLYLYTLRYVFYETTVAVEQVVGVVRQRIHEKIRRLSVIENKKSHEMYAQLTQNTELISQSTLIIFLTIQSVIILFFTGIYLLWLSPVSFLITIIVLIVTLFIYFMSIEKLNANTASKSDSAQLMLIGRQIATMILFSQLAFYLLLAILVFIVPLFSITQVSIIFKITAIALFIIGPLTMLVVGLPTLDRVNRAVTHLYQLEQQLEVALTQTPPELANLLPATTFNIQMDRARFHYVNKAGEPFFFSPNLIDLIIKQHEISPHDISAHPPKQHEISPDDISAHPLEHKVSPHDSSTHPPEQVEADNSPPSLPQLKQEAPPGFQPIQTMEEVLEKKVATSIAAHETVKNYVLVAMTVGFVPFPLVDIAALLAIQLRLTHHLAEQYQVYYSNNVANSLILSLLSSVVTTTSTVPLASVIKIIPVIGSVAGLVSVAILGGASTYAVGKVFIQHFESGGNFLDFNPEKMKAHFKIFFEEGKKFAAVQQQEQKQPLNISTGANR